MKIGNLAILFVFCLLLVGGFIGERDRRLEADNRYQQLISMQQKQKEQLKHLQQISVLTARHSQQTEAQSQEKVIEYRTILKKEPTCDLRLPPAIANGLLEYSQRLRARALHQGSEHIKPAGISATTARALTYCQAVAWIYPLLSTIDRANQQLMAIGQIEEGELNSSPRGVTP